MSNRQRKSSKLDQKCSSLEYAFVSQLKEVPIHASLDENKKYMKELFQDCSDFVLREFRIQDSVRAFVVLIDGLINTQAVNEVMQGLMIFEGGVTQAKTISETTTSSSQCKTVDNYADIIKAVLIGETGVFIEGNTEALAVSIQLFATRSVSEPETESVVRGPREGFIENLRTNTSLLRRKIRTPHLKLKPMTIGSQTNTNIAIAYLDGVADPGMVKEVMKRLKKIKIDSVLETGYLEEFIQDSAYSPFPQVQYTERPDTVAAALLQGRVAIMVDGTPFVLMVPVVFWQFMQANEDYYERFQIATLLRWLRYTFLIISLFMPGIYVAITTFHYDFIPTKLLLSFAAAREAIPFPVIIEGLIMEITFEALREAGIRLPKTIGQAVSIVGALVVGQAAVQAGIVSAPMVIVVAITGIASFTIPRFNGAIAIRMLRFPVMIAASMFGIYGILILFMLIIGHLSGLRSFGVPYLSPTSPLSVRDLRDIIIRSPWWKMNRRPSFFPMMDTQRMNESLPHEIAQESGQKGKDIPHDDQGGT